MPRSGATQKALIRNREKALAKAASVKSPQTCQDCGLEKHFSTYQQQNITGYEVHYMMNEQGGSYGVNIGLGAESIKAGYKSKAGKYICNGIGLDSDQWHCAECFENRDDLDNHTIKSIMSYWTDSGH